jgi:hypothetical protein
MTEHAPLTRGERVALGLWLVSFAGGMAWVAGGMVGWWRL